MKNSITIGLILLVAFGFQACQKEDVPEDESAQRLAQQEQTIEQYLAEQNITAVKDTNRYYYYRALIENSTGKAPTKNDIVGIYYKFATLEGKLIDERVAGKDTIAKYAFGTNAVVLPTALDNMIGKMKMGETYEFYLPFHAAYANYTIPNVIPANAIVKASISLAQVLSPAEEKQAEKDTIAAYYSKEGIAAVDTLADGVYYLQTQAGTGDSVRNGDELSVRYKGSVLNGGVFDSSDDYKFTVGERSFIAGFQAAIMHMRKGEQGTVVMVSSAGYGNGIFAIPYSIIGDLLDAKLISRDYGSSRDIPPASILTFDLTIAP